MIAESPRADKPSPGFRLEPPLDVEKSCLVTNALYSDNWSGVNGQQITNSVLTGKYLKINNTIQYIENQNYIETKLVFSIHLLIIISF